MRPPNPGRTDCSWGSGRKAHAPLESSRGDRYQMLNLSLISANAARDLSTSCVCRPPLCYNQLFHNHLVEYTAVQGIFSINMVRLPWRQIAWCQLLHGVWNLQSLDTGHRGYQGRFWKSFPCPLKGSGVWFLPGLKLCCLCFCVWLLCSAPSEWWLKKKNPACLTFRI